MTAERRQQRAILSAPVRGNALSERGQDRPAAFSLNANAAGRQAGGDQLLEVIFI